MMIILDKRQKRAVAWLSAFYLSVIVLTIVLVFLRKLNTLRPVYVLNIGVDIFGMILGYVLFICCVIDVQKTGANLRYYLCLLNVAFIGLFTDSTAWLVDELPAFRIVNIIDNTLYYTCASVAAFFFWLYTMTFLDIEKSIIRIYAIVAQAGVVISIAIRLLNLFFGFYFTVDAAGVYSRGPLYPFSLLYSMLTMLTALAAVVTQRKQLESYQLATFFLYVLAPVAVGILTLAVYGLSISYGVVMLVLLLMYCLLNVVQGRNKAAADRDLALASSIQENVLPRTFPYLPERKEFDLYASMTPAKEVGGDFYDFFMIDHDHLALVIADVSGKGVPAALFMMVARTIIKNQTLATTDYDPKIILEKSNNLLCEGNVVELFVTVWLGILDTRTGTLSYANAGHEYPALYRKGSGYEIVKERHSPPLATMEGLKIRGGEFNLNPGDIVYVYTDGVTEATNAEKELYGTERMLEVLNSCAELDVMDIDKEVRSSINVFVKDAPQFDDITMLCLRYCGLDCEY